MRFIKTTLPVILAFAMGLLAITVYFSSHPYAGKVQSEMALWGRVIGGVTVFIGVYSLLRLHWARIRRVHAGWGYSVMLYAAFATMVLFGLLNNYGDGSEQGLKPVLRPDKSQATGPKGLPLFATPTGREVERAVGFQGPLKPATPIEDGRAWIYANVTQPAGAAMFASLGFFICSAAYRTFRAKTWEAGVLLAAALVVMLGQVPLAAIIWERIPQASEWLLSVPGMAVNRAVTFGICLGSVGMCLRVMFGIERSYMGGD